MEPDDPPPKVYGFRERGFQRDNAAAGAHPPLPTAKELAVMAGPEAPLAFRAKAGPKSGDPNDVFHVLQQNRAVERKFGKDRIDIKEVKSRRQREFWLLLVGGNLAIIASVALSSINVITVIFGLAGLIVFSLGLSWVMWQVMDKY